MARRLGNFIDAFVGALRSGATTPTYSVWSAIALLSAAMDKRFYTYIDKNAPPVYPNTYVWLIGGPGAGKTTPVEYARNIAYRVEKLHVAADSMTQASLIDELKNSGTSFVDPTGTDEVKTFHALFIASNELSVLLENYNATIKNTLLSFYDNASVFKELKRWMKGEPLIIKEPTVTMLSATTFRFIQQMGTEPWEDGMMSRSFIVYYTGRREADYELPRERVETKEEKKTREKMIPLFAEDLNHIRTLGGFMLFDDEAHEMWRQWIDGKMEPEPTHPMMEAYNTRRALHLSKLCMICSMARDDSLLITGPDVARAQKMLFKSEDMMPRFFELILGTSAEKQKIVLLMSWLSETYLQRGRDPVPEHEFRSKLHDFFDAYRHEQIIKTLVESRAIIKDVFGYAPFEMVQRKGKK